MAKILSPVLQTLDRIYNFPGGPGAPGEVQVETALQPVHDVSSIAAYASGSGLSSGWWLVSRALALPGPGAGTTLASMSLTNETLWFGGFSFDQNSQEAWWMAAWAVVDSGSAANLTSMEMGLQSRVSEVGVSNNPGAISRVLFFANLVHDVDISGATSVGATGKSANLEYAPSRIVNHTGPPNTFYFALAGSGAINTANYNILIWVGAKGTTPPGVA